MSIRIGIVVGELSGDLLGAGLIAALRKQYPDAIVEGIAGPALVAQGCRPIFPMEKLAVMGIVEVLVHLREILRIRRQIIHYFLTNPPDVFIGVDAPDFNVGVELALRAHGIRTVHYVSPSVWAWKAKRIYKIKRAVDLVLTLFPFESKIYQQAAIPFHFVGHPLAERISLHPEKQAARARLGFPDTARVIALLPGSRAIEIKHHGQLFLAAARACLQRDPHLLFVLPCANAARRQALMTILKTMPALPITLIDGEAQTAMIAADVVVTASGTATLEAMLCKRPMVVAHRLSRITWWLAKWLVKVKYCALPNLLADKWLVPELLQDAATPERIADAVFDFLNHPGKVDVMVQEFTHLHQQLQKNGDVEAARAVEALLDKT